MSIPLTINGITFQYPQEFDTHWGPTLTNWSSAVTSGMLQTSGVNAATLIKSATANPALSGFLELAKTDTVSWRNNANSADLALGINGSNQLTFNGSPIGAATALTDNHIFVGNASNQPADVAMSGDATIVASGALTIANGAVTNAKIAAGTGITLSKLAALTASELVVSDSSGFLISLASPSLTEIGYVAGVTSSIQTQLNTISTAQGNYLPLVGGTMSGAINMGSNKLTSVTQGTTTGDAISFPVGTAQIAANAVTQNSAASNIAFPDSGGTTVSTQTLTTTGGSILGIATIGMTCSANSGSYIPEMNVFILNPSITNISQASFARGGWTSGNIMTMTLSLSFIDTPSAGSNSYALHYNNSLNGGSTTVDSYNFQIIELKK